MSSGWSAGKTSISRCPLAASVTNHTREPIGAVRRCPRAHLSSAQITVPRIVGWPHPLLAESWGAPLPRVDEILGDGVGAAGRADVANRHAAMLELDAH